MRKIIFPLLLISAFLLSACNVSSSTETSYDSTGSKVSVPGGAYTNLNVEELQGMLENKDFLFVNVHVPFEGDIPGTDIFIPYDEIADNTSDPPTPFDDIQPDIGHLPVDKNSKIVLYCRSGRMSDIAARTLVDLGYTNIYNLDGGFNAWKEAGLIIDGE